MTTSIIASSDRSEISLSGLAGKMMSDDGARSSCGGCAGSLTAGERGRVSASGSGCSRVSSSSSSPSEISTLGGGSGMVGGSLAGVMALAVLSDTAEASAAAAAAGCTTGPRPPGGFSSARARAVSVRPETSGLCGALIGMCGSDSSALTGTDSILTCTDSTLFGTESARMTSDGVSDGGGVIAAMSPEMRSPGGITGPAPGVVWKRPLLPLRGWMVLTGGIGTGGSGSGSTWVISFSRFFSSRRSRRASESGVSLRRRRRIPIGEVGPDRRAGDSCTSASPRRTGVPLRRVTEKRRRSPTSKTFLVQMKRVVSSIRLAKVSTSSSIDAQRDTKRSIRALPSSASVVVPCVPMASAPTQTPARSYV
jgi:hypothetical protein